MEQHSNGHIYDKIFKKVLTLSSKAVINFINGLFETQYSTDAKVTYNWTEFHDDNLKRILADTIITIDGCHSYHIEAQRYQDDTIIFRVFEYSYRHAERYKDISKDKCFLRFPEPKVIYLYAEGIIPDTYSLILDFGTQGTFEYCVDTVQLEKISVKELNQRKMIILIPFYLLSLHKIIRKKRSKENLEQLKKLIFNDILGSIEMNYEYGNITMDDASRLKNLTIALYRHLYANYEEMEDLNDMTDESLILEYDIFLKKHNIESLDETVEWIEEQRKYIEEQGKYIEEQSKYIEERNKYIEEQNKYIEEQSKNIEERRKNIEERSRYIEQNEETIEKKKREIEASKKEIETGRKEIETGRNEIQKERSLMVKNWIKAMKKLDISTEEIGRQLIEILGITQEEADTYL